MNEKIKFSCADFSFPLLPHQKALQLIKLLGIDAVDLGIFENRSHHYPSEIVKNPFKEAKKLSITLNDIGLDPADVFLQTGEEPQVAATNTPDDITNKKNRNTFQKMLEFTKTLRCKHMTGLPGVLHKNTTFENDWEKSCEETLWRIERAEEYDIVYGIEPHVGSILPDVKTVLQFIEEVPGITLTLDYGHFIYQGQTNESVHALIPYASHFHARGGAKGQLQTTVDENEIDYEKIVSSLKEVGYSNRICLEYVYVDWEGCNRTDNVSETIRLHQLLKTLLGSN